MPEIGEVRSAKELGRPGSGCFVFQPCPVCGKPRWTKRSKVAKMCVHCACLDYNSRVRSGEIEHAVLAGEAKRLPSGGVLYRHPCRVCGREIWHLRRDIDRTCSWECSRTLRVRGKDSAKWTGGRRTNRGYVEILLQPGDQFYPMATENGYVLEHRLVIAKLLNRCLESWEIVHHINGIRGDNQLENLELLPSQSSHRPSIEIQRGYNRLQKRVETLETESTKLRAEITALQWQVRDLRCDIGNTEPSRSPSEDSGRV